MTQNRAATAGRAATGEPEATAFRATGEIVGNYHIRRLLARGGLSEVYLAENQVTESLVVIKVLAPRFENRADLQQRLKVEAQSGEILAHPNIVRMRDAGITSDGRVYIAMDYVQGRTLRQQLDLSPTRRLNLEGTLQVMIQIVSGIRFAHRGGVIHRDLKPENVMVLSNGTVKIVDFGIAKLIHRADDSADMPKMGTLRYLSPEQIRNEPVDEGADIYALGIILYEMLGGQHPFELRSETASDAEMIARHLSAEPMPLPEILPDEDAGAVSAVWRLVQRCLAKAPKDRPSTDEVLEALCAISRTSVVPMHPDEVRVSRVIKAARARQAAQQNGATAPSAASDATPPPESAPTASSSRSAMIPAPPPPEPSVQDAGDGQRRTEPAFFDPAQPVMPFAPAPRPQLGVGHTVKLRRPELPSPPAANLPAAAERRNAFAPAHVELTPTPREQPLHPTPATPEALPIEPPTRAARPEGAAAPRPMIQNVRKPARSSAPIVLFAVACGAMISALGALGVRVLRAPTAPRPPIVVAVTTSPMAPEPSASAASQPPPDPPAPPETSASAAASATAPIPAPSTDPAPGQPAAPVDSSSVPKPVASVRAPQPSSQSGANGANSRKTKPVLGAKDFIRDDEIYKKPPPQQPRARHRDFDVVD